ncbi:MAG: gliding motility-associated C-terminal domain-containing protein [Crocinitomicaceae bacterium]
MKKLYFLIFVLTSHCSLAQCEINTSASVMELYCGQCTSLSAFGSSTGQVVLDEDFNTGGFGNGWDSTPGAVNFSNPCSPGGVDGTPHAWMDDNTSVPRTLESEPYDLSGATAGVTICFDLLFAAQGDAAPCEGPDEPDEGVFLEYSTDGGMTWQLIHYFDPNGGNDPQLTNWNNWCFELPLGAITANTIIRWTQTADSGAGYDHWGIDNVQIFQNDINSEVIWLHDNYSYGLGNPGGVNPTDVCPTTTTTYTAQITTGTGDVCTSDITIIVQDPVFDIVITSDPDTICSQNGECADITATADIVLDQGGIETYENNEFSVVASGNSTLNVNVQGINTNSIYDGLIQNVVINGFNFSGTSFCTDFGGCPCNGTTVAFGGMCNLDASSFTVTLTAPNGCGTIILAPSGVAGGNYNNTTFVPVGGTALGGGFPNGGTWDPAEPFSNLNGCDPNGVWTLEFDAPGLGAGVGTLSGWSITFDDPPITQPVNTVWSNDATLSDVNSLTPTACPTGTTTYTLNANNGIPGCATSSETITIVDWCDNPCTPPTLSNTSVDVSCLGGNDGSIDLSINGTSSYDILWSNAAITEDINGLSAGTYDVTVTDQSDTGCFETATITINDGIAGPTAILSGGGDICLGGTTDIQFDLTGLANWNIEYTLDGAPQTAETGITISPLVLNFSAAGTYEITMISDAGGCPGTFSGNAIINILPEDDPTFTVADFCYLQENNANILGTIGGVFSFNPIPLNGESINPLTGEVINEMPNSDYSINYQTAGACPSSSIQSLHVYNIYDQTENSSVCTGGSYTYPDGTTSTNITVNESHVSNLTSVHGCDSVITTNITVTNAFTSTENVNLCAGSNYTYPDGTTVTNLQADETHVSSFISTIGCDSLVTTNLTINPVYNITEDLQICENETVTYPDGTLEVIVASTSHQSNLSTQAGCDSIVITNIDMLPLQNSTENTLACENTTHTFPDGFTEVITANTSHQSILSSADGCDSVVTTNVIMNPNYNETIDLQICIGSNHTYPDGTVSMNIQANETQVSTLTTSAGCDSIITTNITVLTSFTTNENFNLCEGTDYTYPDGTISTNIITNESHVSNLVSSMGCDSIVTTNLNINPSYNLTENTAICENETYTFPDGSSETITVSTVHISHLSSIFGCDSIITTNVHMNPDIASITNVTICQNEAYTFPDGTSQTIHTNTVQESVLSSVFGCDSTVITYVTMSPNFLGEESVSICPGEEIIFPDGTIHSNIQFEEQYTSHFTSVNGCDSSIVTLVSIYDLPEANFSVDNYLVDLYDTEIMFTNNSYNSVFNTWNFGDNSAYDYTENPSHTFPSVPNQSYIISLAVESQEGCLDTAYQTITVEDVLLFYVPNAFTPDGDQFNETFQPVFVSGFDPYDFHLLIFNRWGEVIFESYDASVGWDGTYGEGGLVQDGVYTWKIDFKETMSDKKYEELGHVVVLK